MQELYNESIARESERFGRETDEGAWKRTLRKKQKER